jgi:hypothetical protein
VCGKHSNANIAYDIAITFLCDDGAKVDNFATGTATTQRHLRGLLERCLDRLDAGGRLLFCLTWHAVCPHNRAEPLHVLLDQFRQLSPKLLGSDKYGFQFFLSVTIFCLAPLRIPYGNKEVALKLGAR